MAEINPENLDQMIQALKTNADLSVWKNNRNTSPLLSTITQLNSLPKTQIPALDFNRVKNQVLDRISVPVETEKTWLASILPRFVRISIVSLGSLLIVISLGMGTAIAALESVPGQTIYPLKKAVESVQLSLASEEERTALQLRFANKRVEELERILERNEQGIISDEETQKVISQTVKDLKETTEAAASGAVTEPNVINKLADLGNKIKSASIQTEGEAKLELEKALEATKVSQEEAIKNIENAGLQVENQPILIAGSVTASGELTEITATGISIGTTRFLITEQTSYVDIELADLKLGQIVDVEGEIKDNKTYAVKITLISDIESEEETSGANTINAEETIEEPTDTPSTTETQ